MSDKMLCQRARQGPADQLKGVPQPSGAKSAYFTPEQNAMLTTELYEDQIPTVFAQLQAVVGDRAWLEPAQDILAEIEKWPYMRDHHLSQYRVVMALRQCSLAAENNGGILPMRFAAGPVFLETFAFAFQVLQLIEVARRKSNKRADVLVNRVREALRSPRMLQAMQLEARIATHFVIGGRRVLFPELGSNTEHYDVLVEDLGPRGLEIECKVVTHDKGRKIHRTQARHFLGRLQSSPFMLSVARSLKRGLAVRVMVPARMPPPERLEDFYSAIERQVLAATSGVLADGTHVDLIEFDTAELGKLENPMSQFTMDAVERITGARNPHFFIHRSEGHVGGVVLVVLCSAQPDSMLHETFVTFAESAGRQLTGSRPGALIATFEGLGSDELTEIGSRDGGVHSPLASQASAFLERSEYPHVVGVGFFSEPDFSTSKAAEGGATFWIPKKTSPLWSPEFSGLFGKVPRKPVIV